MGTFYVDCEVVELATRKKSVVIKHVLVDTGSEYSWIPGDLLRSAGIRMEKKDLTFVMANGAEVTRSVGYALIRAGGFETVDEVVFAEEGDLKILGARTLEGFPAVVDPRKKRLVASGPLPAAGSGPS